MSHASSSLQDEVAALAAKLDLLCTLLQTTLSLTLLLNLAHNLTQALEEEVAALRSELNEAHGVASRASATWDSFRKERDFHRMHHKRVAQEKNKLITDIKRLKVGTRVCVCPVRVGG